MAEVIVAGTVAGLPPAPDGQGCVRFVLEESVGRGEKKTVVRWDCNAIGSLAVLVCRGLENGMTVRLRGRLSVEGSVVEGEMLLRRMVWVTGVLDVSGHSEGGGT